MQKIIFHGSFLKLRTINKNILELAFDSEKQPINIFNEVTIDELSIVLSIVENQSNINGLIFTSTKRDFVVGADIHELRQIFEKSDSYLKAFFYKVNNVFNRIESLPFPTAACIDGFALGGGFELCLACDFRVLSNKAIVGLPETKLGIIPGWGGTIRLPRLIGLHKALEWIITGKHKTSNEALLDGAADVLVESDELQNKSLEILKLAQNDSSNYKICRKQKQESLPLEHTEIVEKNDFFVNYVFSKYGDNFPAPLVVLDLIIRSARLSKDEAQIIEYETFQELAKTSECRSLMGLFISEQYVGSKAKKLAKKCSKVVTDVAVLGAGIMGGGIAYQNALKGFFVLLKDISNRSLSMGMSEVEKILSKNIESARISNLHAKNILTRIKPTLDYEGVEKADIAIEAVVENEKIKSEILVEIEKKLSAETILTSNTSTISIDHLSGGLKNPERFCGMHFFNPVHAMPLVEIVRSKKTSNETIELAVSHAIRLGKKPIIVNDCPGFLVNRILFPAIFAFEMMVADGADFQEVDKTIEAWGWPMGPAYLLDVIGLDTAISCFTSIISGYPDRMKALNSNSPTWILYKKNRLGQKNQKGFYRYQNDKRGKPKKYTDEQVSKLFKRCSNKKILDGVKIDDDSVLFRFIIPMCIEASLCLEEGIVNSPSEIDMSAIYGLGFPIFRGGLFRWMDEIGLDKFCKLADDYKHLGKLYKPTLKMRTMAKKNKKYYS